jgi:hypothetical protein
MRGYKKSDKTPKVTKVKKPEHETDDVVQYVRAMFPISLAVFTDYLNENGFTNAYEGSELHKMMKTYCSYVCVNLTKKVYVLTSSTFKHTTINSEEFKEKYSGHIAGSNYGI